MIRGETVYVESVSSTQRDAFNKPIETISEVGVDDVLVCPTEGDDVLQSNRPDGKKACYTLHFPKAFSGEVGKRVKVRGRWLDVIGEPDRYLDNCPTRWNMPVYVGEVDG